MTPAPTPFNDVFSGNDFVLLFFYFLIGFYALFTAVLYYHWQTYSTDGKINFLTFVTYFAMTIPLVIALSAITIM